MIEVAVAVLLVTATAGGLALGAYRAAQDPRFYAAVIKLLWDKIKPVLLEALLRDFSPENVEKVRREARTNQPVQRRHGPKHPGEH